MVKFIVTFVLALCPLASHADKVYSFGILPGLPPITLEKRFGPLVDKLSEQLQQDVVLRTRATYSDYNDALLKEEFDIALIDGFTYLKLRQSTQYRGLVRKQTDFHASLLTFNPEIKSIAQLKNLTIAFPAPEAGVTRVVTKMLQDEGLGSGDYTARFYGEHASCLVATVTGSAAACATSLPMAQEMRASRADEVTIIGESPSYPHMLLVVGPRLGSQLNELKQWFLQLNEEPETIALLQETFLYPVGEIDNAAYESLRDLLNE